MILVSESGVLNTICATCSYYNDGKIKNDSKYQTCVRQIIESVKMPNFLFFCFKLCQGDKPDEFQYINLKKYKSKIKTFVTESFDFNNLIYIFNGAIYMPTDDHYSSYCHLYLTNELNLENNKSYYYNSSKNKGKIELVDGNFISKINHISQYNIFIVLYVKNN